MDSKVGFDNVKFEKAKAMERFNRFRKITKIWQIFEVFLVFALVSWSSTRVSSVLKIYGHFVLEISSHLLNHHVVFLIGNVIIILLFILCRETDAGNVTGTGDFSDDYVKHRKTGKRNSSVSERESTAPLVMAEAATVEIAGGDEEKKIIVSPESMENDNVTMAIENASRQIKKFQRTQTEKLKREIAVKPRRELRRSETENFRAIVTSGQRQTTGSTTLDGAEINTLSNEEFQRTVEEFIQKNWSKKLQY
ncbi:Hypothetical predicted protein [Olea europaea subsp. europaea]|uniref:Uncharacterized protein n=1 Tax=Olea europaea subsp. europaea TaxID=158383 RepID=A0A8S0SN41_OLEEU|nr:Hypothetical predicted protein [Olea europaea subsp. europaea]